MSTIPTVINLLELEINNIRTISNKLIDLNNKYEFLSVCNNVDDIIKYGPFISSVNTSLPFNTVDISYGYSNSILEYRMYFKYDNLINIYYENIYGSKVANIENTTTMCIINYDPNNILLHHQKSMIDLEIMKYSNVRGMTISKESFDYDRYQSLMSLI